MTVEETLAELVRINSVSSRSNREIISWVAEKVRAAGFYVREYPYRDETGTEKLNLIALAGGASADSEEALRDVELALVGHTDTVPFSSSWPAALQLTLREDRLYGRGSCDTKGFIAATLSAAGSVNVAVLGRPLALVFTADEEIGCLGAKRLADDHVFSARYAIIGEPTSLRPTRAGKGYCLAEVIVRGREGHSAYPATGASAITCAARLIARIEQIAEQLKLELQPNFDPPFTTLNVGLISGGTAKNIIPGECRFTLEWRPVPGQDALHLLELVRAAAAEEMTQERETAIEINPTRLDEAMATPADSRLVRTLESMTAKSAGTISFGTEAPQLAALGAEAVVFGPGDIRVAHRSGEFVPVDELRACEAILARAIEDFCH